jgi:hypothetical protein
MRDHLAVVKVKLTKTGSVSENQLLKLLCTAIPLPLIGLEPFYFVRVPCSCRLNQIARYS